VISHRHKFVFIHVPKTAGSSIETVLQKNTDCKKLKGGFRDSDLKTCPFCPPSWCIKHKPFYLLNEEIKKYYSFGFVRNPWDLVVSSFHWWLKSERPRWVHRGMQNLLKEVNFDNFIRSDMKHYLNQMDHKNYGQLFWLQSESGFEVDFIGRFENLQEDFNTVCDKIGISKQQLPHANKSKHKHYTEYYDDETKQIVAELYAKDIEYFGYKFGE
jgi:hypothetical protein